MATEATPRSGLLAPVSTGTAQAVLSTTAPSARDLRKYMTLSRVRFGSPTGVARVWRAVARGFASPAFAGFAFLALPLKRGAPCRTACVDCYYANKTAANSSMTSRVAGGPADLATRVAVVP